MSSMPFLTWVGVSIQRRHKINVTLEQQEIKKIPKQAYMTEFKELAAKRVADGQALGGGEGTGTK
jgi:hypothetical protein